jgi:hypothetical protein
VAAVSFVKIFKEEGVSDEGVSELRVGLLTTGIE